jgi:hypothetical protein
MKRNELTIPRHRACTSVTILLLCGLTCLFSSCEKDLERQGAGRKIAVKISLTGSDYADVTRSSTAQAPKAETVEILLGDGLYVSATLAETPTDELRATVNLAEGQKVRLAAFESGTNTQEGVTTNYIYSGGTLGPADPAAPLMVEEGVSYEIVAYSYYNETANYPATTAINSSNQLLWGKSVAKVITQADPSVSLTMTQRFAQVKVSVSSANLTGTPNITSIGTVTVVSGGNRCNLTEHSGEMVTGTPPAVQTVSGWTPNLPSVTITSAPRLIYPVASDTFTTVTVGNITVNGAPYSDLTTTFSQELLGGRSYTLTMDLRFTRWAGSNIYWDGSKMTFYPAGHVGDENLYQGLYFKWGSMIGVSGGHIPNNTRLYNLDPATIQIYYPTGPDATDWSAGFVSPSYADYASIPSLTDVAVFLPGFDNDFVTSMEVDYTDKFGDICRRIDPDYRLPTLAEFGGNGPYSFYVANTSYPPSESIGWYIGRTADGTPIEMYNPITTITDKDDGTYVFNHTYGADYIRDKFATYKGGRFPFPGYISYSSVINSLGILTGLGTSAGYATSSAYDNTNNCHRAVLLQTSIHLGNPDERDVGFTIRCIKND